MKTKLLLYAAALLMILAFKSIQSEKKTEPWTKQQLMEPAVLAEMINKSSSVKPIIINIGSAGSITGSIDVGPAKEMENLDKLKLMLEDVSRDTMIVIYCGCCPFDQCPNIRPPFELLNKMNFSNHKLLPLPHNLKVDWIDKGFPVND